MIHSYSPVLESKVPFCSERSFSVKRGPISRRRTFSADLNTYLCGIACGLRTEESGLNIPNLHVMSEEDVVSLIVEGDCPPTLKLWLVVEQGRQHPGNGVAQASGEIVQDHLRPKRRDFSPVLLQYRN